jgi:hypothetical protein
MKPLPAPTPDTPTLDGLRAAIQHLEADRRPRWGKMNAPQMLRHCRTFHELCLGRVKVSWPIRVLAGLLGPVFLRRLFGRSPLEAPRNLTTLGPLRADPALELDFEAERDALLRSIDEIEAVADGHRHPLYGTMRAADVRNLARHHLAHHCNQFGLLGEAAAA